jgi:hypothetical protein
VNCQHSQCSHKKAAPRVADERTTNKDARVLDGGLLLSNSDGGGDLLVAFSTTQDGRLQKSDRAANAVSLPRASILSRQLCSDTCAVSIFSIRQRQGDGPNGLPGSGGSGCTVKWHAPEESAGADAAEVCQVWS